MAWPRMSANLRHGFFPVLDIRQRLLLKLQFVRKVVEARRVVAAVPDERTVGLIGVDQDQQILDLTGQPPLLGLVDVLTQVRHGGVRLVRGRVQAVELVFPEAAEDKVRLRHQPEFERVADVAELMANLSLSSTNTRPSEVRAASWHTSSTCLRSLPSLISWPNCGCLGY